MKHPYSSAIMEFHFNPLTAEFPGIQRKCPAQNDIVGENVSEVTENSHR